MTSGFQMKVVPTKVVSKGKFASESRTDPATQVISCISRGRFDEWSPNDPSVPKLTAPTTDDDLPTDPLQTRTGYGY